MKNSIAMIAIGATPFIIDPVKKEFRQFNKPDNVLNFSALDKSDDVYTAVFNIYKKNITVKIPAPVIDAAASWTKTFKKDINAMSQHNEWGFYLGDHDTALRLSGRLPHIDLAGTDFTIDWRLKEFRETELPWKSISFKDMEMSDSGEEYLCFYNTESHELFSADENLFEMPENVVVLEIPNELKLDPVAVAREYGIGETDLLFEHPFQMNWKAKVTPLSATGLDIFIAENISKRDALRNINNDISPKGRRQ